MKINLKIDRASAIPPFQQVVEQIHFRITAGELPPGSLESIVCDGSVETAMDDALRVIRGAIQSGRGLPMVARRFMLIG